MDTTRTPYRTGLDRVTGRPGGEWLDISAASDCLGVSPEALRKRIRRGTVTSEKRDGRWYICLDNDQDTVQDTSWTQQDAGRDALVEQLQRENTRLWEANEHLTRLLDQEQQLAQQRLLLQAGHEEGDDSTTAGTDTPPHRWWRFWR